MDHKNERGNMCANDDVWLRVLDIMYLVICCPHETILEH